MDLHDTTVRCFSFDAKQAALFFGRVIPFFPEMGRSESGVVYVADRFPASILPEGFGRQALAELEQLRMGFALCIATSDETQRGVSDLDRHFWGQARDYCERYQLMSSPIILPSDSVPIPQTIDSTEVAVALTGMRLIDVSRTPWEKIIEFRKDERARKSLSRLLNFLSNTYNNTERTRIKDDLMLKLDDLNNVIKDWRFDTCDSTITMMLNSKLLAASGIASLAHAYLGGPAEVMAAAAAGAAVEIASLTLHLRRRANGLARLRRDHPLAYLLAATEKLTSG